MLGLGSLWGWLTALLWGREMEVVICGLSASGKTTYLTYLRHGAFVQDVVPTLGFNVRKVKMGRTTLQIWDLSGQEKFRTSWTRYAAGATAILYLVDAVDRAQFERSKVELQALLSQPSLQGIPVLVLATKSDLPNPATVEELIALLELEQFPGRELSVYAISCKEGKNIDLTVEWLLKRT